MSELLARARGLHGRLLDEPQLADIERASDTRALAAGLGRAGLAEDPSHEAIERTTRARVADDLATLARWSDGGALLPIELDEDRRSLRAIVRGLAVGVPAERRRLATTPTSRLTDKTLATLAAAASIAELADELATLGHPLARAFSRTAGAGPAEPAANARPGRADAHAALDVLAIEHALARSYAELAREHAADRAVRAYVAQAIDGDNAGSALLLAARGGELSPAAHFIPGGERLTRERFATITKDNVRDVLAAAFAGTPLARTISEDAILDWQIATQRALRRSEPHGLAAVIYLVLCRRREARRLRRAAWRLALGGAP